MFWVPCLLLANILAATAITPENAVRLAEQELSNFPEEPANGLLTKRYKKVTTQSLQMSKRNTMMKTALNKLDSAEERLIKEVRDILTEKFRDTTGCASTIKCSTDSKYRTVDGTCNNKINPTWGAAGSQLQRLHQAIYGNAASTPKTTGDYRPREGRCSSPGTLPNSRLVSSTFHPDSDIPSTVATHMLTQMGQFLDHDLSLTPEAHVEHCCTDNSQMGCSALAVLTTDPFYSTVSQTCLEFTRSEQYCDSSPREQFNSITSYIDASNVYGSTSTVHASVRDSNGYLLKVTSTSTGKELLPQSESVYFAGDVRAIEMPGLATMHTLFVREHNRIAKAILAAFPNMNKETIFQETRRIVGAEMQNVVYGQYLPTILSPTFMSREDLIIDRTSTYNPNVNADVTNAFATAAYRFGHSMIQGEIERVAVTDGGANSTYTLKDIFFNLDNYDANNGGGMEEILLGLISQASQSPDRLIIDDVTNHLFNRGAAFGTDLISRNIARGRDHGLPTYGFWRRECRLPELCNWDSNPSTISRRNWDILKTLYDSPNDIDLFTAGLAETPVAGSVLGETFSCIIAKQFGRQKFGDRYFFTHQRQIGSFTQTQITNLKTRDLGQIICDNTDIKRVRSNVFQLNSQWIDCPRSSTLDLKMFNLDQL